MSFYAAVHRIAVLLMLLAAPLGPVEQAANERLRQEVVVEPLSTSTDPRSRAGAAALAVTLGHDDAARALLRGLELPDDCLLRTRRAELLGGPPCPEAPPAPLATLPLEPPAAATLLASPEGLPPSAFFAAASVDALAAAGGGGSLALTTDRFRVVGPCVLEGLWYLDDRILVLVRPSPACPPDAARDALDRLAARWSARSPEAHPDDSGAAAGRDLERVEGGWFRVDVPAGWSRRDLPSRTTFAPAGSGPEPTPEAPFVVVGRLEDPARRGRNPVGRRRPRDVPPTDPADLLPPDSVVLERSSLPGGLALLRWSLPGARGGEGARAVTRALPVAGHAVAVVASVPGAGSDLEDARRIVESLEITAP